MNVNTLGGTVIVSCSSARARELKARSARAFKIGACAGLLAFGSFAALGVLITCATLNLNPLGLTGSLALGLSLLAVALCATPTCWFLVARSAYLRNQLLKQIERDNSMS